MEKAIQITLVEVKFDNSASATAWYKPWAERSDATPMELGNADVVCYKGGKRGHVITCCYVRVAARANILSKRTPFPKGDGKNQRARCMSSASITEGSGNAGVQ